MTIECKPITSDYECISKEIIRNKGIKELNDIKTENLCSKCECEVNYLVQVELFTPEDFNAWQSGYYID